MTFPRYPEYKDSGLEWLGEVPAHWEVVKLGYLAISKGGGTPPKDELHYWNGSIPWVTPKDMKQQWITSTIDTLSEEALHASAVSMIEPGHVLMVFRSGILRHRIPAAINKIPLTVNQDLRAYDVRPRLVPEFFLRLTQGLNSELLIEWSKQGATVESLDSELVRSTQLPVPPMSEQEAITAFLDHETARIDALVQEQQRLIELLKEKRQAVISHAVTKGLDPNVPTKDSGVEWLGEVPAHWEMVRLKQMVAVQGGATPAKDRPDFWDGEIPWVSPKDMKKVRIDDAQDHISVKALSETGLATIEPGAVLIVVRGMILAHSVPVGIAEAPLTINQDMKALTPTGRCSSEYLLLLLSGIKNAIFCFIDASAHGTRKLEWERFENIWVPLPSVTEQESTCSEVFEGVEDTYKLIAAATSAMSLLGERRSALISAAVTGKIDVRGWKPPASTTTESREAASTEAV